MEIEDSGDRREFETGAVRDMAEGKGRMDLLPWEAIMEVSRHCENGAKKYGEHNVDKGLPTSSFCDSALRHMAKYLSGWKDEPHLLACAWNVLWAIQMEITHPEMVNTPWNSEPTVEEMRKAIEVFCEKHDCFSDCPLIVYEENCYTDCTDEQVREHYKHMMKSI